MCRTLQTLLVTLLVETAFQCSCFNAAAQPPDQPYHLDWSKISETANQLEASPDQDDSSALTLVTKGDDPFFRFELPRLPQAQRDWILQFEYFCAEGIKGVQLRFGDGIHRPKSIALPSIESAEGWTTYSINLNSVAAELFQPDDQPKRMPTPFRVDLGRVPGIRLQIRNPLIRQISDQEVIAIEQAAEIKAEKERMAEQIQQYYMRDWAGQIRSVRINDAQLVVEGRLDRNASTRTPFLIARRPESVAATAPTPAELQQRWIIELDHDGHAFRTVIPGTVNANWFAPGSRFQVCQGSGSEGSSSDVVALTPAIYCQTLSNRQQTAPPKLIAAKGLTCVTSRFSPSQLRELGLGHASVNLLVNDLVSPTAKPGWDSMKLRGRSWWINTSRLRRNDRNIKTINDAGLVAAGILLIPNSNRSPASIAHPESSSAGTYAMPNLVDREAMAIYTAALELLGERYCGSHPQWGRLDHWIVHNEVDYGWQWTNMGQQPMDVFMDHYVRSMRLVDAAARRHNPYARVFISLTHRWNTVDNRHWKTYAPKAMLQWLIRDSQLSGDFPWGVAYHPYPQSLWRADFWNDTRVSDDFDTELITMKNLQVLDRFLHLPSSRTHDGQVRPMICSEQGYHADENDPAERRRQAAALLLTWKKLRQCPSVLAFDYHRPSDHPREGGLRLGLRGLPNASDRLGVPKPAWEVYSAIGTEREPEMVERYRSVWESNASDR